MSNATVSATTPQDGQTRVASWVALGSLLVVLLWSYWNSLTETAVYWEGPQYSHGFLVPVFTVLLLWLRRKGKADAPLVENVREKRILVVAAVLLGLAATISWFLPSGLSPGVALVLKQIIAPLFFAAGILVVGMAAVVIWGEGPGACKIRGRERWCGVVLLALGLGGRLACAHIGLDIPDMYTFVPSLAGVILLAGGAKLFRWAGPAAVFLLFMFPLPWSLERALLAPLQSLATDVSTFSLQTLGIEAYNDGGNRICIEELQLGVVDQCSGLRMTTIFLALSVAIVLLVRRSWWENLVILLSAVPIALTVNVVRITVTGVLYRTASSELAERVFHDWAGYMMMPLALALLWLELTILSHLFVEVDDSVPVPTLGRWR
ncbi:MAG: exosortase/archaeosortase family protein [Thermoguttaceae bacterium]|jgi:exosortase